MYAVLPKGAKPSKSVSKDQTRPVLTHAELRQTTEIVDGERKPTGWELIMSDSYQLARVKLSVMDADNAFTPELVPGPISTDALKAIEKSTAGAFTANGTVDPRNSNGAVAGPSFAREDPGRFPQWDALMPEHTGHEFAIGLDAELLYQLAQSLGAKDRGKCQVRLTFTSRDDGTPNPLRPMVVTAHGGNALEGQGLLMPVRIDA